MAGPLIDHHAPRPPLASSTSRGFSGVTDTTYTDTEDYRPTPPAPGAPLQVRRAWALARAHGHEWATDALVGAEPLESWEDARAAWEAYRQREYERIRDRPAGFPPPALDGDGAVHHVTGSGRTRWSVYADGRTVVVVTRPGDVVVAEATIRADGRISRDEWATIRAPGSPRLRLHWRPDHPRLRIREDGRDVRIQIRLGREWHDLRKCRTFADAIFTCERWIAQASGLYR